MIDPSLFKMSSNLRSEACNASALNCKDGHAGGAQRYAYCWKAGAHSLAMDLRSALRSVAELLVFDWSADALWQCHCEFNHVN